MLHYAHKFFTCVVIANITFRLLYMRTQFVSRIKQKRRIKQIKYRHIVSMTGERHFLRR